jgi:hypothetical protein
MSPDKITEVRRSICSVIGDLGGVCERLRDLEDPDLRAAVVADSQNEITDWLLQAAETLRRASLLVSAE